MIPASEFVINPDGSCFHLHVRPDQLADKVVMCGDPARVDMIASFFDSRECDITAREFHTITGTFGGKRITAISHGIGPDNIDIVLTELDALKNVDFQTRELHPEHHTLEIVRVGTCGGLQPDCPVGTAIVSDLSVGFDGVLNWYAGRDSVCDLDFERELTAYVGYPRKAASPYVVRANEELAARFQGEDIVHGVTVSAVGFYGPQGRVIRLPLASPLLNQRLGDFRYADARAGIERRITNYEMESAPLAGLSLLLGHKAVTVCSVVANRVALNSTPNYHDAMERLVRRVLEVI